MSPTLISPSNTLIKITTPLYESNLESKINAFSGLEISPLGGGRSSTIFSSSSSIPWPVFADVPITSNFLPVISPISFFISSGEKVFS